MRATSQEPDRAPSAHPYRTPAVIDDHLDRETEDPPAFDMDIAPMLALALVASLARVLWAEYLGDFDVEASWALGTALVCAALLWPVARHFAGRLRAT